MKLSNTKKLKPLNIFQYVTAARLITELMWVAYFDNMF